MGNQLLTGLLFLATGYIISSCTLSDELESSSISGVGGYDSETGGDAGEMPSEPSQGANQQIQAGKLTAGDIDDNLNFGAFLNYSDKALQASQAQTMPEFPISDRITLKLKNNSGTALANVKVTICSPNKNEIFTGYAGTDGVLRFFPSIDGGSDQQEYLLKIELPEYSLTPLEQGFKLSDLDDDNNVVIKVGDYTAPLPAKLDLALVIDATGSMSDELSFLISEFSSIINTLKSRYPIVSMRFALIMYRDIGDEYVVRKFEFTSSLQNMQTNLANQRSGGGGDYPEAMDQALSQALSLQWDVGNTSRMLFLVADAPPHNNNVTETMNLAKQARSKGVRIFPIAASGVADLAEFIMRSAAVITQGRHLFLTDDSGIGNTHAEPKIPCYQVTLLDDLMLRVISSQLEGRRIEAEDESVIRTSGQYADGVCLTAQQSPQAVAE